MGLTQRECDERKAFEAEPDDDAPHCMHDLPEHHEYAPGKICCFCGGVFEADEGHAKVHGLYSTGAWVRWPDGLVRSTLPPEPPEDLPTTVKKTNANLAKDLAERLTPALQDLQRSGWDPANIAATLDVLTIRLAALGGATLLAIHQLLDVKHGPT